jgi:hypothetical protein
VGETKPKGCSQFPAEDRVYWSPEQGWRWPLPNVYLILRRRNKRTS